MVLYYSVVSIIVGVKMIRTKVALAIITVYNCHLKKGHSDLKAVVRYQN